MKQLHINQVLNVIVKVCTAAVSCSPNAYRLGGVKIGLGLTGWLGCAWVLVHGMVPGLHHITNFHSKNVQAHRLADYRFW